MDEDYDDIYVVRLNEDLMAVEGADTIAIECPECGIVEISLSTIPSKCRHIMFCYHNELREYADISPMFNDYIKRISRRLLQSIADLDCPDDYVTDDGMPTPDLLEEHIPELQFYTIYPPSGALGTTLGYASDELIKKM